MVLYECPRCHYETSKKSNIRNHYNRKRVCKTLFSRKSIKDCKDELESKDRLCISELERKNKELEDEVAMLKQTQGNNNTISIHNGDVNNNNYIININDFNSTNYQIALEDLKQSIKQSLLKNGGKNMNIECENLIELVHCNDKYPENHNILITDRTRGEAKVKKGNKFINTRMDDAIDETTDNIINLLKDNKLFNRYVNFHENKDEDTLKEDKKAIERTLYNNRDKIQETASQNGIKIK